DGHAPVGEEPIHGTEEVPQTALAEGLQPLGGEDRIVFACPLPRRGHRATDQLDAYATGYTGLTHAGAHHLGVFLVGGQHAHRGATLSRKDRELSAGTRE